VGQYAHTFVAQASFSAMRASLLQEAVNDRVDMFKDSDFSQNIDNWVTRFECDLDEFCTKHEFGTLDIYGDLFEFGKFLNGKREGYWITENQDGITLCEGNFINNEKIIRWYCINSKIKHEKLTIIPYGLDYHTMSFGGVPQWGHIISCYDQELLLKKIKNQAKPFWERKIMCYSNFHHSLTNNIDRVNALNEIPNNLIYYQYGLLTRETTWTNQTEYAFVVSPSGVGLDCIRTWEALCFGCIPIVKKCGVEDLFIDLPVLIVNEWSEITNELLVDTVEKFKNMTFNYEKLKLKYWADQINQYRHLKI